MGARFRTRGRRPPHCRCAPRTRRRIRRTRTAAARECHRRRRGAARARGYSGHAGTFRAMAGTKANQAKMASRAGPGDGIDPDEGHGPTDSRNGSSFGRGMDSAMSRTAAMTQWSRGRATEELSYGGWSSARAGRQVAQWRPVRRRAGWEHQASQRWWRCQASEWMRRPPARLGLGEGMSASQLFIRQ
jgi:hypothetical protein